MIHWDSLAYQAHIALSGSMSNIDQQGSSHPNASGLDRSAQARNRSTKEEIGENKKLEDMSLNRREVCDTLQNDGVYVKFSLLLRRQLTKFL